ncbi:uncharacterized protein LOC135810298 [Sycon ciliatum]|uniref:uncharacterized protein LOC135810298 n=1 Tax=Sycon ciliatum TaxID=27933 RepID=UPI0031F702E7
MTNAFPTTSANNTSAGTSVLPTTSAANTSAAATALPTATATNTSAAATGPPPTSATNTSAAATGPPPTSATNTSAWINNSATTIVYSTTPANNMPAVKTVPAPTLANTTSAGTTALPTAMANTTSAVTTALPRATAATTAAESTAGTMEMTTVAMSTTVGTTPGATPMVHSATGSAPTTLANDTSTARTGNSVSSSTGVSPMPTDAPTSRREHAISTKGGSGGGGSTATVALPTATVASPTATVPSPTSSVPSPTATVASPTATVPSPTATVPSPTATVPSPTASVPSPTATVPSPTATTTVTTDRGHMNSNVSGSGDASTATAAVSRRDTLTSHKYAHASSANGGSGAAVPTSNPAATARRVVLPGEQGSAQPTAGHSGSRGGGGGDGSMSSSQAGVGLEANTTLDEAKPLIITDLLPVYNYVVGRELTLECVGQASPRPTVHWHTRALEDGVFKHVNSSTMGTARDVIVNATVTSSRFSIRSLPSHESLVTVRCQFKGLNDTMTDSSTARVVLSSIARSTDKNSILIPLGLGVGVGVILLAVFFVFLLKRSSSKNKQSSRLWPRTWNMSSWSVANGVGNHRLDNNDASSTSDSRKQPLRAASTTNLVTAPEYETSDPLRPLRSAQSATSMASLGIYEIPPGKFGLQERPSTFDAFRGKERRNNANPDLAAGGGLREEDDDTPEPEEDTYFDGEEMRQSMKKVVKASSMRGKNKLCAQGTTDDKANIYTTSQHSRGNFNADVLGHKSAAPDVRQVVEANSTVYQVLGAATRLANGIPSEPEQRAEDGYELDLRDGDGRSACLSYNELPTALPNQATTDAAAEFEEPYDVYEDLGRAGRQLTQKVSSHTLKNLSAVGCQQFIEQSNGDIEPYGEHFSQQYTDYSIEPYTDHSIDPYRQHSIQPYSRHSIEPYSNQELYMTTGASTFQAEVTAAIEASPDYDINEERSAFETLGDSSFQSVEKKKPSLIIRLSQSMRHSPLALRRHLSKPEPEELLPNWEPPSTFVSQPTLQHNEYNDIPPQQTNTTQQEEARKARRPVPVMELEQEDVYETPTLPPNQYHKADTAPTVGLQSETTDPGQELHSLGKMPKDRFVVQSPSHYSAADTSRRSADEPDDIYNQYSQGPSKYFVSSMNSSGRASLV